MKKFWLPYPMWDMVGIELWLNEMAAQGWALGDWPQFTFIGRVPFLPLDWVKESRYRLDPINQWFGEQDLCRRAASYRDMGWRYVTQIGKLYAVYRCDDPEAPDLYTDRVSLGWAMKEFIRRQWGILAVTLVWAALMIGDHLSDPARLLMQTILRGPGLLLLSLMMLLLVGGEVVYTLAHTVRLTRIRKKLLQGELPGPGRRSTYRWPRFFLAILGTVVLALALMIQMICFPHAQFQPLDGPEDWDCPHVLLSEAHPAGTEPVQIKPGDEWKYSTMVPPPTPGWPRNCIASGRPIWPGTRTAAFGTAPWTWSTSAPYPRSWPTGSAPGKRRRPGHDISGRQTLWSCCGRRNSPPPAWTASSISLIRLKTENFPGIFTSVNPAVRYLYFIFRARSRKKPWTCWRSGWRRRPSDTPMKMK